jgi:adenine deaminase
LYLYILVLLAHREIFHYSLLITHYFMSSISIFSVTGVLVDPLQKTKTGVEVFVNDGRISSIQSRPEITHPFIIPGFVDAHVHVESSMLIPSRFAALAVRQGTVAVVTDPHEVANVAGIPGVEFMIEDGKTVPLDFFFGAPSCVPASPLEKSGAIITGTEVESLLSRSDFYYLSEMMNFPGVINDDADVWQKINSAHKYGKPIDGHAPGLGGEGLRKYAEAGISTDHECSTLEEAQEKMALGMKILIREGSAARNFSNLISLLRDYSDRIMFCTDDCHPDYLLHGHINKLASRAVKAGYDVFDVLKACCVNPVEHYKLPVGKLRVGDRADFVLVNDLTEFDVKTTYIDGKAVFDADNVGFQLKNVSAPSFPFRTTYTADQLDVVATGNRMNAIIAVDGELVTEWGTEECSEGDLITANPDVDLLKIVLLDRYSENLPVVAFIRGFGLKTGSLAGSIAHDSHHIIAVGCDDASLDSALKWVVDNKGGICFSDKGQTTGIALPFFGLMTDGPGEEIAVKYEAISKAAKAGGCNLSSPFMTLSFMALTVIPNLKINHNGLFDGMAFKSVPLFFRK